MGPRTTDCILIGAGADCFDGGIGNVIIGTGRFDPPTDQNDNLVFFVDGQERLRFDSQGRMYINGTMTDESAMAAKEAFCDVVRGLIDWSRVWKETEK